MGQIKVTKCEIEGLFIIEPQVFGDSRGYFIETYHKDQFFKAGIDVEFVQDNQSSSKKGVLRGLHFQKEYPQDKLVRVLSGEVFDVAVDLRKGSPTFGKWQSVVLSEKNHKQFFVPLGVKWPLVNGESAILSDKDSCRKGLREYANERGIEI